MHGKSCTHQISVLTAVELTKQVLESNNGQTIETGKTVLHFDGDQVHFIRRATGELFKSLHAGDYIVFSKKNAAPVFRSDFGKNYRLLSHDIAVVEVPNDRSISHT